MQSKQITKKFYVRLVVLMLGVASVAAALEYRSYRMENLREEKLIRSVIRQTLEVVPEGK